MDFSTPMIIYLSAYVITIIYLRIEYATRLMQENPHLSLRKVAEQSGFRSQPTFRKAFQEVMGCLPSEIHRNKGNTT